MAYEEFYPPILPEIPHRGCVDPAQYAPLTLNPSEDEIEQTGVLVEATTRLRHYGLGDNSINYTHWFQKPVVYRQLIFEHLNISPFIGSHITDPRAAAIVYFYSVGRLLDQRVDVIGLDIALSCAEFLIPMINKDLLVPEYHARGILVHAVRALMTNGRRLSQEVQNLNAVWGQAIASDDTINESALADFWGRRVADCPFSDGKPCPSKFPLDDKRAAQITPDEAMTYLLFLASVYPRQTLLVELLATTYVACAKKGQITFAFATKIEKVIEAELGYKIQINTDAVRLTYQHFGKDFNETTAPLAFNRWNEMLPDQALRLRLIIEHNIFSRQQFIKSFKKPSNFPQFPMASNE